MKRSSGRVTRTTSSNSSRVNVGELEELFLRFISVKLSSIQLTGDNPESLAEWRSRADSEFSVGCSHTCESLGCLWRGLVHSVWGRLPCDCSSPIPPLAASWHVSRGRPSVRHRTHRRPLTRDVAREGSLWSGSCFPSGNQSEIRQI